MTDNQKLQLWQAGILGNPDELQVPYNTPDYLNDDAAAMGLLDTLVEKIFSPHFYWSRNHDWTLEIQWQNKWVWEKLAVSKLTRRAAVCAAVLKLIERETLSGKEDV